MSRHLDFRTDRYRRGEVIFGAGSIVTDIGLVLSGSVRVEHTDLWGNKSILGITSAGGGEIHPAPARKPGTEGGARNRRKGSDVNPSYRFFENRNCEYFPCHEGLEGFNCLFCYCPLYLKENCPGKPAYIENGGRRIKDCSGCTFPHRPENYDAVIRALQG